MCLFSILIWCAIGYCGGWIAAKKGYAPQVGVIAAILAGPIALVVCALLPTTEAGKEQAEVDRQINQETMFKDRLKQCPSCARDVSITCRVCPRCEHRFASEQFSEVGVNGRRRRDHR